MTARSDRSAVALGDSGRVKQEELLVCHGDDTLFTVVIGGSLEVQAVGALTDMD